MFFEFDAVTPVNTLETAPVKTIMKLNAGIVHRVAVRFPPGNAGLVHVRIKQGGVQLWPRNQTGNIKGDNETIDWNEVQELTPDNNTLVAETWNEDTDYPHTPTIRIGLLQKEELFPEIKLADLIRLLFKWFRRRN